MTTAANPTSCRLWAGGCPCAHVRLAEAPEAARELFVLALHELSWRCVAAPRCWGLEPGGAELVAAWDAAWLVAPACGGLRVVTLWGHSDHDADELRDGDSALWAALAAVPRDAAYEAWAASAREDRDHLKRSLRRLAPVEREAVRGVEAELAWACAIAGAVAVLPRPLSWVARDTPY